MVPSPWQTGGPITLANDTLLVRESVRCAFRRRLRASRRWRGLLIISPVDRAAGAVTLMSTPPVPAACCRRVGAVVPELGL